MKRLCELHLHLDGSLRPETVWELAREQKTFSPEKNLEEIRERMEVPEDCKTLTEYLERFDLALAVLQEAAAVERVTFELVEDLAREGVTYGEIRFAPQLSTKKGLSQEEVIEAAIRGAKRGMEAYPEIQIGLILCFMRGEGNEEENLKTLEAAKKYMGDVVCAVDIAGAEALYPTENFAGLFEKVREAGLPMTVHAGEAAGPESMWEALKFGTKRIGHGVAAVADPELVKELIRSGVTLEVCPTSNIHTKKAPSYEVHPIRALFDAGVRVTVSSDNRTCSRTSVGKEIEILRKYLGFTDEEIEKLQENAWEARFVRRTI